MSRARHGAPKGSSKKAVNAGGNPFVMKDAKAKERKKGGKVVGCADGSMAAKRMDRPGRKRGGRVGADTAPLSSAHNTSSPSKAAD